MIGFIIGVFVGGFLGVTLMAICAASSKEPPAPDPIPESQKLHNPYAGKVAYSKYFKSYIMVTWYGGETVWKFILCDQCGRPTGWESIFAKTPASEFKWYPAGEEAKA